ncbi:LysR family transcriptional regulator [Actinoplanes friuliensis]|uniref:LysR-family transcriptional regulator n=1 Tax=Actinoplanes friuliensis DSM 7358 TaxID=1246995 RepID=U5VWE0_9ACTN|nr:LysR family transcriptional regulator [Actinoplanes friuliensis]AGZ41174.1 LysR-family transcriptional regulator [Actinoplanes friuliensis DSM 7358]
MRTASIDLNLLAALDALLAERNVTRAGRRLGMSQPAMSEALARLRRHFGDQLLVRVGNNYELTPLGAGLRSTCAAAMQLVEQTFTAAQGFDPEACEREFVLLASDYAAAVLGPPLMRELRQASPVASLRLDRLPTDCPPGAAPGRIRVPDGLVLPRSLAPPGLPGTTLFSDRWVCLAAADNPAVTGGLTVETLAALPWVLHQDMHADHPVLTNLRARGLRPEARFSVGGFHLLPELVRGTDHLCLIQERLAARVAGPDLCVLEVPFDLPPVVETLWWDPAQTHDPSHRWLRDLVAAAARGLTAEPGPVATPATSCKARPPGRTLSPSKRRSPSD